MHTLAYQIVDVFTDHPFTGNALAVVFGADGLTDDQMQALAREFNQAETVFVLPPGAPGAPGASYRVRIFTPDQELPFAGHPSIGAAVTMMRRGLLAPGLARQECGAGILPIEVDPDGRATLTGGTPWVGPPLDPAPLLAAVGLDADDLAGPAPRSAGCGLNFTYLPVRPEAVARARLGAPDQGLGDVCLFAWDPAHRRSHARVLVLAHRVEDPATGSAALGFGVWLVTSGLLPGDADSSYVVHQGLEVRRPSTLECTVSAVDGVAVKTTVRGGVVPIATGDIAIPPAPSTNAR